MSLSIIPVGGYGEVGRNCTAVKVDDDIFLLDLGLHLENYIQLSQDDDVNLSLSKSMLIREKAVPDIDLIDKKKVKAILISHAHLDHVGAIPFLANSFEADIHATPFTIEVARKLASDKKKELRSALISHPFNEVFPLSETVSAEFIEVTHSTLQCAAVCLHTPYGKVLYVNDFKLDTNPPFGNPTDLQRLSELRPKVLIIDSLYADQDIHMPGEDQAVRLLQEAMLRDLKGRNIIVTTFSSHIARITEIVRIAKQMDRRVMIVGRSMARYLEAAKEVGLSSIIDEHEVVRYGSKARKALAGVGNAQGYVFIVTGGMAEPKAVLSRIVDEELLPLRRKDVIIFSNKVIPTPTIIEARKRMESKLRSMNFEVLTDLHVSGHGAGKDHEELLQVIRPDVVLPVHAEDEKRLCLKEIAIKCGVKSVLLLKNGEEVEF